MSGIQHRPVDHANTYTRDQTRQAHGLPTVEPVAAVIGPGTRQRSPTPHGPTGFDGRMTTSIVDDHVARGDAADAADIFHGRRATRKVFGADPG